MLAFAGGYLAGSVPLGLLVGWLVAGIDVRDYGTGNIGASNVRHNVGFLPALVVALGVFLQGFLPPLAVRVLDGPDTAVVAAAAGAAVGYGWPAFVRFSNRSGRGVGVSTGAAAVFSPGGFVALLAVYGLGGGFRQMGLATLAGFIVYAGWVLYFGESAAYRAGAVLLLVFVVARRLEGVGQDLHHGPAPEVLRDRLLFDRRPGQSLTGPSAKKDTES